ncbi:M23 family metallopeptidase [Flavitalea flava]
MKNILLSILLLSLLSTSLPAQRVVEVSYTQDAKGNFTFYGTNHAFCNYILQVNFTKLEDGKPDHSLPYLGVVKPGSNKLFTLTRANLNSTIVFNYKTNYNKGCLNPTVNPDFVYLLPLAPGKETQAYELQNTGDPAEVSGSPASGGTSPASSSQVTLDPTKRYAVRLRAKPGDTLYASRRGTVTGVNVGSELNDAGKAETESGNFIEIVHADCSFGLYGVVRQNSAFVKPGQLVEAGDPIGLIGGDRYGRGSEARFSVFYNQIWKDVPVENGKKDEIGWAYVPLKFWTKKNGKGMLKHGGTFISEHPENLVTQEMSKAELLKRKPKPKTKK